MGEEIKYFPQQTYISFDLKYFCQNNVNGTGCYMCICFILHLAKLVVTIVVLIKYAYLNVLLLLLLLFLFNLS